MPAKDLMIKCPVTGKEFYSGLTADETSIMIAGDMKIDCPRCGGTHTVSIHYEKGKMTKMKMEWEIPAPFALDEGRKVNRQPL